MDMLSREVKQCWYADDASAGGELQHIKVWWDGLMQLGPQYAWLLPQPSENLVDCEGALCSSKCHLCRFWHPAHQAWRQYLGSAIGSAEFSEAL